MTAGNEKTKKRLSAQELSKEETSCSASGSDYSNDDLSSYYSETETDVEDSTMYTDGSDFVSIWYNTTDTGDHPSDSEGSSVGSEEGVEQSFDTREGEYESDNHAAKNPKKAKGALAMLGSLAGRAKKGM